MKRIINITVEYDISEIPLESLTPREVVEDLVEDNILGYFIEDEGFESFKVDVSDIIKTKKRRIGEC